MIGEVRLKQLHDFLNSYSKEELIWINGYLSGIVSSGAGQSPAHITPTVSVKKISLLFGTETGNSKRVAAQLVANAKKKGIHVKLQAVDQYRLADLSKEEYLFIVISTHGEGEPPLTAKKFYDHIHQNELNLSSVKFSVLALGDSSYPFFCKTGEDVDLRLNQLGASRIAPLQKCDIDFEEEPEEWFAKALQSVNKEDQHPVSLSVPASPAKVKGKKIYNGTILTTINLNDRGSNKSTYHIEIGTDETIQYEPGDAIGIVPRNRPETVDRIISLTGIDPTIIIQTAKYTATVTELLTHHLTICYLLTSTIKKYGLLTGQDIPDIRMDLADLLRIYPVQNAGQFEEVIKVLMPVAPRLYSVSSSPLAHGTNEIHITVARNQFRALDEQRIGLCSEFLGDMPKGTAINFYVHKNKNFKLPAHDKNIIMIGPGTGVAPFRSFIAERDAAGATGKNWFFFGEQYFVTDFLYQAEMQQYLQTGVLTNIDLAFSRDQADKIYVQNKMKQKAGELYTWINNGALVYISGTKDPMSKDVENALLHIIEQQGNKTREEAEQYLEQLYKEGRYEKDVY
jgi:sulfite reductase (NADPH) flavoprotein alpha-component